MKSSNTKVQEELFNRGSLLKDYLKIKNENELNFLNIDFYLNESKQLY